MSGTLRVLDIVGGTAVDGPGLRTSIYFAGCDHRCPGCHNPQSWDPYGGTPMTVGEIMAVVTENGFNVTFSGGDPLEQPAETLTELARAIRAEGLSIWCYTGFLYEEIARRPELQELLQLLDTVVDGPFVMDLRDTSLTFRGSSNQRLIKPGPAGTFTLRDPDAGLRPVW